MLLEPVYMRTKITQNRFEISNRFEKFLRLHDNFTTAKLEMPNLFQKLFRLHGDSTTATFRTIVKLIAFN